MNEILLQQQLTEDDQEESALSSSDSESSPDIKKEPCESLLNWFPSDEPHGQGYCLDWFGHRYEYYGRKMKGPNEYRCTKVSANGAKVSVGLRCPGVVSKIGEELVLEIGHDHSTFYSLEDELKTFAAHFKKRRNEFGVSQKSLGLALGTFSGKCYSDVMICNFENNKLCSDSMSTLKPLLENWIKEMESPTSSFKIAAKGQKRQSTVKQHEPSSSPEVAESRNTNAKRKKVRDDEPTHLVRKTEQPSCFKVSSYTLEWVRKCPVELFECIMCESSYEKARDYRSHLVHQHKIVGEEKLEILINPHINLGASHAE